MIRGNEPLQSDGNSGSRCHHLCHRRDPVAHDAKRSRRQLTSFNLLIVIALGSAMGDVMF
jgi:hypothetical protein